jgi:hypothetical protein
MITITGSARRIHDRVVVSTPAISERECVEHALAHLRLARDYLLEARARKAADKVRKALTSAYGAERNMSGREHRAAARSAPAR